MKPNKFQNGDRVKVLATGKTGTIETCINLNDKEDVKAQGYRYEVQSSRELWSIPENCLLAHDKN